MASGSYDAARKAFLDADIDLLVDTIKCVLLDADYSQNYVTHDFLDDVAAAGRVGTPQTLGTKSTAAGVFDAADVTFPAVSNATAVSAVLIYKDTGVEATSAIIVRLEFTALTPNGGDIIVAWDNGTNKIFKVG